MPDATFDWDTAETAARKESAEIIEPSLLHPYLMGWDAAMAWVKRTAMLRLIGGRPDAPRCDHQHQETNRDTGRRYCLECNATIAVFPPPKPKRKRSPNRRRGLARKVACPTCDAEPGNRCLDRRRGGRPRPMKGVHQARQEAARG